MSQSASPSGMVEILAALGPGVSQGCPVALGDGQLRHSQRAACESVFKEASSFCLPLCSDQFKLVKLGGRWVSRIDGERVWAGRLLELAGLRKGDGEFIGGWDGKPKAVNLTGSGEVLHKQ